MSSTFTEYFEEDSFETDVFLIGGTDRTFGCNCIQEYVNPENSDDTGCYARFGALIDEKDRICSWHNRAGLYWPEEIAGAGGINTMRYKANTTYRMVLSRAKKSAPREFKGSFMIRESKGQADENSQLTPAAERYRKAPDQFDSPMGTFLFNPWVDKFVLDIGSPDEEFYLGPCIIMLECDKDNPESCSTAHEYAIKYYQNYYDWFYRLVDSAVKNLLKKNVDWLLTDDQYRVLCARHDGEWRYCTYASRVAKRTWFDTLTFDTEGSFTAEMCCSVLSVEACFTMTGSVKTNRVKRLVKW